MHIHPVQRRSSPETPTHAPGSQPVQRSGGKAREVAREGGGFDEQSAALAPIQMKGGKKDTGGEASDQKGTASEVESGETEVEENKSKSPTENAAKTPESDEELRKEILSCGDWNGVKGKWVKTDAKTMQRMVDFRKKVVDGLVEELKKQFEGLGALSLGSTALTSDYDITFSGPSAVQAVVEFNKRFGKSFGAEAGAVFDTNVYAQNFLQTGKPKEGDPDQLEPVKGGDANQAKDDAQMDVAALIKVRKNMSQSAWDTFKGAVVSGISQSERAAESARRFDQADQTFKTVYVKELIAGMLATDKEAVLSLRKEGKDDIAIVEELIGTKGGLAAANRTYEKKLLKVESLIRERDKLVQKQKDGGGTQVTQLRLDALSLEIRKAHSEALLFANEPYFSAGTIRHVVGNLQGQWGLDIGANEHFQSFNENYGDTLKELHHLHGHADADVLVKSSKYVYRFLDAAVNLGNQAKLPLPGDTNAFKNAEGQLLDIRQGKSTADALSIGKSVGVGNAGELEKKVSSLAVLVNTKARNMGAAGSSVDKVGTGS